MWAITRFTCEIDAWCLGTFSEFSHSVRVSFICHVRPFARFISFHRVFIVICDSFISQDSFIFPHDSYIFTHRFISRILFTLCHTSARAHMRNRSNHLLKCTFTCLSHAILYNSCNMGFFFKWADAYKKSYNSMGLRWQKNVPDNWTLNHSCTETFHLNDAWPKLHM